MDVQARTLQDAAKWQMLLTLLDTGTNRIAVVLRDELQLTGGDIAGDGDEIVEHMLKVAHEENPEGLPFDLRMLAQTIDPDTIG